MTGSKVYIDDLERVGLMLLHHEITLEEAEQMIDAVSFDPEDEGG